MPRLRGVYPRAGGETIFSVPTAGSASGLSPRGRGNPHRSLRRTALRRSIPARAGKPRARRRSCCRRPVYPRAGGETTTWGSGDDSTTGLSPRGRGNPRPWSAASAADRSIPARAGKPPSPRYSGASRRVYPRAGGETPDASAPEVTDTGLSPRGRGNLQQVDQSTVAQRSIPARAGKPESETARSTLQTVYPRAGGETTSSTAPARPWTGLSPRGRGNRHMPPRIDRRAGSIPARAGKPPRSSGSQTSRTVYPRAGGETDRPGGRPLYRGGLSPRGRGNHGHHHA